MRIGHIALVASSEEMANRFYKEALGLKELRSTVIPASLSKSLFGIDREFKVIDFGDEQIKFEVFIGNHEAVLPLRKLDHICLEVEDREAFLKKCKEMDFEVLRVPKGDSLVIFLKDGESNLFEIKEKKLKDKPQR
jgi:catechol 2,3-dioxygenase-like lactoylglutathione lyase family enzyme